MDSAFGIISRKSLPNPVGHKVTKISSCFLLKVLWSFCNHFEFLYMAWGKASSFGLVFVFGFLLMVVQLFHHYFLKRLSFLHYTLFFYQILIVRIYADLFLDYLFCSADYFEIHLFYYLFHQFVPFVVGLYCILWKCNTLFIHRLMDIWVISSFCFFK